MLSGRLVTPVWAPFSSKAKPNFGRDDDVGADRLEGLADEVLVVEGPVHLSGVEEGHAALDRGAQEGDHLLPRRPGPE
jgi:hypothetical protein